MTNTPPFCFHCKALNALSVLRNFVHPALEEKGSLERKQLLTPSLLWLAGLLLCVDLYSFIPLHLSGDVSPRNQAILCKEIVHHLYILHCTLIVHHTQLLFCKLCASSDVIVLHGAQQCADQNGVHLYI